MNEEWISARETNRLLRGVRTDIIRMRQGLWVGDIEAKARRAEVRPRGTYAQKRSLDDWSVPAEVWKNDPDASNLDLLTDRFNTRAQGTGFASVECVGLRFNRAQLCDYLELDGAPQAAALPSSLAAERSGAGRRPNKKDWGHFAAALATVAATHPDGVEVGTSAADIYERVAVVLQARLSKDAPFMGEDNVRDAITLAQEWVSRGFPD